MASIAYQKPSVFLNEAATSFPVIQAAAAAGHTGNAIIQETDLVAYNGAGTLLRCATNQTATPTPPAGVAGYATASELASYGGTQTTWSPDAYDNLMFGFSQVGTILPAQVGYLNIIYFTIGGGNVFLDINLRNDGTVQTGWVTGGTNQVVQGSFGGLFIDPTTNLFVFDPTQSNKILTIAAKPIGPLLGVVGDVGARVRCYFNSGLAI